MRLKTRMDFVEYWAEYVRTHSGKDWSKQQNIIVNSQLNNNIGLTKEEYLKLKSKNKKF